MGDSRQIVERNWSLGLCVGIKLLPPAIGLHKTVPQRVMAQDPVVYCLLQDGRIESTM